MHVEERFRKCVGFIYVGGAPIATAFLVKKAIQQSPVTFAVTAKHLLEDAPSNQNGGKILTLKINSRTNGVLGNLRSEVGQWLQSAKTDIAIWRCPIVPDEDDVECLGFNEFAAHPAKVGDEVFLPGLFSQFLGNQRIEPVVRFGNIAMLPNSVTVKKHDKSPFIIRAYLVETRSWAGDSGSPVFCLQSTDTSALQVKLLGISIGNFDPQTGELTGNTGISIVVPSSDLRELIDDQVQV